MTDLDYVNGLLGFPFCVHEGYDWPQILASRYQCSTKQIEEYRQALVQLGLLAPSSKEGPYELTELGRLYATSYAPERNQLMIRQMFNLPPMRELLLQLLMVPTHTLSKEQVKKIFETSAPTSQSMKKEVKATQRYLRWLTEHIGVLRADKQGAISIPQ